MTTFQRRHYKAIAEVIQQYEADGNRVTDELIERFSKLFSDDNSNFSSDRFKAACKGNHVIQHRTRRTAARSGGRRDRIPNQRQEADRAYATFNYTVDTPEVSADNYDRVFSWSSVTPGRIVVTPLPAD